VRLVFFTRINFTVAERPIAKARKLKGNIVTDSLRGKTDSSGGEDEKGTDTSFWTLFHEEIITRESTLLNYLLVWNTAKSCQKRKFSDTDECYNRFLKKVLL